MLSSNNVPPGSQSYWMLLALLLKYLNAELGVYSTTKLAQSAIKRCEICSKLTKKTPERRQWCRSGVFINVNFKHIHTLL